MGILDTLAEVAQKILEGRSVNETQPRSRSASKLAEFPDSEIASISKVVGNSRLNRMLAVCRNPARSSMILRSSEDQVNSLANRRAGGSKVADYLADEAGTESD